LLLQNTAFFRHFALTTLVILLAAIAPSYANPFPPTIRSALKQSGISSNHVGLIIQPLNSNTPSTTRHASQSYNPASVMKVVTTLAALDTLGPAHIFKTHILVDGTIADSVLTGDLIIQGGGDPALNLEHFRTLLHEIRMRGIRRIDGDVIFDDAYFAIDRGDPGQFDGEPLKPYNAEPTALLVNYNALPLRLAPTPSGVSAFLDPPGLPVDNTIQPDTSGVCTDWQDQLAVSRDGDRLELSGRYPVACGDRLLWLNLMCPPATVATLFQADWAEMGGSITGQIRLGETPVGAMPLLDFDSPELSEIVRLTNKYSNNVMAKMLFLDLGAARFGAPATWEKGQQAIRDWLSEKGLNMPELVIENGSGLSRIERISAGSMAKLLIWASRQPLYYEFAASLPALGLEGTQRHRLKDTPLAGRAWLKSGSLDGVHNLAGYVLDADGQRKVVVLFINDQGARNVEAVQAAVLHWAMDGKRRLH
jgi:D-alanyl-D-alanine carboxypeptidase/D-alanyl-D-alanine-endopeptidase (penicillin-binding protein 4)